MSDHNESTQKPTLNRRRFLAATSSTSLVAGLSGCLDSISGGGGELTIGATFPRSGAYSSAGEDMVGSMELAIEQFDGQVGGKEVDTLVRDSGTAPGTAVPAVEDLINVEGIDVLLGGFSSSVIIPQAETAQRNEIPYLPPGGATLSLTGENCKSGYFGVSPSSVQYTGSMVMAAREGLMDSLYLVVPDYEAGFSARDAFSEVIPRETDVEIAGSTTAELGADDYSAQITDARESDADMVLMIGIGGDAITFVTQATNAGLDDNMRISMMLAGQNAAQGIPDDIIGDIYAGTPFYWQAEGSQEFSQMYADAYDKKPNWWAAHQFAATMELLTAIDETGGSSSVSDVRSALEGRSFDWTRPDMQWRECDHRAVQPYYLVRGVPPAERDEEAQYWDVVGEVGGETIMRDCTGTGCSFE